MYYPQSSFQFRAASRDVANERPPDMDGLLVHARCNKVVGLIYPLHNCNMLEAADLLSYSLEDVGVPEA
jgi:hypothetical protein